MNSNSDAVQRKRKLIAIALLILAPYIAILYIAIKKPFKKKVNTITIVISAIYSIFLIIYLASGKTTPAVDSEPTASSSSPQISEHAQSQEPPVVSPSAMFKAITSQIITENFSDACKQIGIDVTKVNSMKLEEENAWTGGPSYSFKYEGEEFYFYCDDDLSIDSITLGYINNVKLYLKGFEPLQVSDYLPDLDVTIELDIMAEQVVKRQLNYPKTAKFSVFGWNCKRYGDIYVISNTVTAENAFGVEEDIFFFVQYDVSGSSYELVYFVMDGVAIVGEESAIPENLRAVSENANN